MNYSDTHGLSDNVGTGNGEIPNPGNPRNAALNSGGSSVSSGPRANRP